MIIKVEVKTGRSKESVQEIEKGRYVVSLIVRPIEGKANKALQGLIAQYFGVAPSCVVINKGKNSRVKSIEVTF